MTKNFNLLDRIMEGTESGKFVFTATNATTTSTSATSPSNPSQTTSAVSQPTGQTADSTGKLSRQVSQSYGS